MSRASRRTETNAEARPAPLPRARPLLRARDYGESVTLDGRALGVQGDRWFEPFVDANRAMLASLDIRVQPELRGPLAVKLTTGSRIGAVPLVTPSTRRVVAGLMVSPRFQWSGLGAVLGATGFTTEPTIGSFPLVPGSAREVPSWVLAAPVIRRLESIQRRVPVGFVPRFDERPSPRGRVDWTRWATHHVPAGRWGTLPCHFSELSLDATLLGSVRWTLARLEEDLVAYREVAAARALIERLALLRTWVGPGPHLRPSGSWRANSNAWIHDAFQAMGWVADERGLGGSNSLDGLSWALPIDELWEAWVAAFVSELAPRCGLSALRSDETTRRINWSTPTRSMHMLIPDAGLRATDRVVWVDAKYKAHLQHLRSPGWSALASDIRDAHRADLHQALAYASLDDVSRIDSLLVYPDLTPEGDTPPAIATIGAGRRRVRLLLVSLPFGFRSPDHKERTMAVWRDVLAA